MQKYIRIENEYFYYDDNESKGNSVVESVEWIFNNTSSLIPRIKIRPLKLDNCEIRYEPGGSLEYIYNNKIDTNIKV